MNSQALVYNTIPNLSFFEACCPLRSGRRCFAGERATMTGLLLSVGFGRVSDILIVSRRALPQSLEPNAKMMLQNFLGSTDYLAFKNISLVFRFGNYQEFSQFTQHSMCTTACKGLGPCSYFEKVFSAVKYHRARAQMSHF